ncbi:MAG: Abi family protein [Bacteroidia bacterium]
MNQHEFEIAISKARFEKYLIVSNHDFDKAFQLYILNLELSKSIFGILSIYEITLRNAINYHYINYLNDENWIVNQCKEGGIFNRPNDPNQYYSLKKIKKVQMKLNQKCSNDRLVAELSLGFWVYLFASYQFKAGGQNLHQIFINRPKGTKPKTLFYELNQIRLLRNRIAHHEAICFNKKSDLNPLFLQPNMEFIIKHFYWLAKDELLVKMKIYDYQQHVHSIIHFYDSIKSPIQSNFYAI